MKYELTLEQRDRIMGQLSEEQRHFIHHVLVRGRRTMFARQLARKKCQFIPEDAEFEDIETFIEEWDYIGFTDSGEVSPHTKCECGRSLRYQHQVLHLPTNTMRYFGIEHLHLHTGIDAKTISAIMKGFDVLDGEMNEIMCKYRDGWQLSQHMFLPFPAELDIPQDIQAHLNAGLPLLDRQLIRLRGKLRELENANKQKHPASAHLNNRESTPLAPAYQEQGAFVFDEIENSQGSFVFGEAENNQGAFWFEEIENNQGAFVFEETVNKPIAPLFGTADMSPSGGLASKSSDPFHLPPAAQRVVDDALPFGRISTRAVSEFLIEQKLVRNERMSTGKPSIYIGVAAYLDKLVSIGKCELVTGSSEDRVYSAR
ncbi:MAG: DUF3895 domain-containing protein [Bacillota bacterium]